MSESGSINEPTDETLTFNINLDERSSLDNVSTWNGEGVIKSERMYNRESIYEEKKRKGCYLLISHLMSTNIYPYITSVCLLIPYQNCLKSVMNAKTSKEVFDVDTNLTHDKIY